MNEQTQRDHNEGHKKRTKKTKWMHSEFLLFVLQLQLQTMQPSIKLTFGSPLSLLSSFENTYFFLRFYLFIHERHTERERQRQHQREKQAPCREPNAGLDPRTPRSHPEPKADTQPPSHPSVPCGDHSYCSDVLNKMLFWNNSRFSEKS